MPKGPKGEWRPTSTVAAAVHVARLSTGEVQETRDAPSRPDPEADHQRARKGGKARAASMTPQQRSAPSLSRDQAEMRIWRKIFTTELSPGHLLLQNSLTHPFLDHPVLLVPLSP